MKNYETIAILKPDVSEEYVSNLNKKLEKAVSGKPGQLIKKEDWGQKRLAYEIDKHKQGRYLSWTYFQSNKGPAAADKVLRFDENVLRFLTYVVDERPLSPRAKAKAAKEEKKVARTVGEEGQNREVKVDFKNPVTLVRYVTERGKILPRRNSGVDAKTQREIAAAVKRARQIALLSYTEGFAISGVAPAQDVGGES